MQGSPGWYQAQACPPQGVKVVSRFNLVNSFLSAVRIECDHARADRQPVLVLRFSHDESTSKGVYLGLQSQLPTMVNTLLEMEDFCDAVGNNFDVCVLSTACFSSGWAVNPKLNTTRLAAAGPGPKSQSPRCITSESGSWSPSIPVGRMCGSIYATTVDPRIISRRHSFARKKVRT